MPSSTTTNRTILNELFTTMLEWRDKVSEDGHVDISGLENVEHEVQFDFENLDNAKNNRAMISPVLFHPMELANLERYPVESSLAREFLDIDQTDGGTFPIEPDDRVRQVSTLIEDRATREAQLEQKLDIVVTFWLEATLDGYYSNKRRWNTECVIEPCPNNGKVYPHLAFHLIDVTTARENSILYSELSALVEAMRGRANQRKVESEVKREKLYEDGGRGKEKYPYLFGDEEHFPVLMVSCVMPQHARLFTACMSQRNLVIRQSKLYSFEWRDEAPVDLFTRLFLSRPLEL
ncbi:hypothetical protein AbraIFM66950_006186 [Aspergillus brasiliensis]|nr:hypothetical protein AbraIFM66950_006186 [Aspergillus brasiliensis]